LAERAASLARSLGLDALEFEALNDLAEYTTVDDPGPRADAALDRMDTLARGEQQQLRALVARWQQLRRRQAYPQAAALQTWLETALRLGELEHAGTLVVIGAGMYAALGRPDEGVALMRQHHEMLERNTKPDDQSSLYGNLATTLANQDRFDEALPLVARAMAIERDCGDKVELMRSMVNSLRYYRAQGRLQTALACWQDIERWHAAEAPNPLSHSTATSGMAEALCDLERWDEALQLVDRDLDRALRAAGRLALAWPVARAKTWLALGQPARALQALQAGEPDRAAAPGWLDARWLLMRARTEARLRSDRLDHAGDAALAWLEQAARAAPRDHRRLSWFECELQRAAWSAPADGAARAELVASLAQQQGMIGHALHARWRAAERLLAAGRVDAAQQQWQQAQALRHWRFGDAAAGEPVFASGLSTLEAEAIELALLRDSASPAAAARAAELAARLHTLAAARVPAAFRDAFLHRHPVHRELLALAARLAAR
jgi:tetratricopeptide (TPR) repeat protein